MNRYLAIVPHEDRFIEMDAKLVEAEGLLRFVKMGCVISGYLEAGDSVTVNVTFPSVAVYLTYENGFYLGSRVCSVCGRPVNHRHLNNADPFKGKCCDTCNVEYVIPQRIGELEMIKGASLNLK